MPKSHRFVIDCADHAGFMRLANGQKTVLTRANKSSRRKDDYTQSQPGDILELVDNKTNQKVRAKVISIEIFNSLSDLFHNSTIAEESFDKRFASLAELEAEFEKNRPGYTKVIDQHGLVAWRIALL